MVRNAELKDLAAKKSHQVVAEAFIPIDRRRSQGGAFKDAEKEANKRAGEVWYKVNIVKCAAKSSGRGEYLVLIVHVT